MYLAFTSYWMREYGVDIWAYCLMPNHVHFVAVPSTKEALGRAFAVADQRYAERINKREGWTGTIWQYRFWSYPMDEAYLLNAVRYVERNPVEAGMVEEAGDYPWSSASAHLRGQDDALVSVRPMLQRVSDWKSYLAERSSDEFKETVEKHQRSGWPAGEEAFIQELETRMGRRFRPKKPGPQPGVR